MIRISQIKLPVGHDEASLWKKAAKLLKIQVSEVRKLQIRKRSLDARKKPLQYVYVVDVQVQKEESLIKRLHNPNISIAKEKQYQFPAKGKETLNYRPVIVGSGPAGLFCGLMLARAGYAPIILERGLPARERQKDVDAFWQGGALNPNSNVQFGEGGAGTFSDGKLNTLVKDPAGRNRKVLQTFVEAGAPEEILYVNKPHLGTDVLVGIVEHLRQEIEELGGTVLFSHQLIGIQIEKGQVQAVKIRKLSHTREELQIQEGLKETEEFYLNTNILVLAIGHSARETFAMLKETHVPMEQKAFAVGVRIEHPQELINQAQYGEDYPSELEAAAYKLTRKVSDGRGVYSFCMCPGGYVVNASSESEKLAINGMSYQARDGRNANSAMIVTVRPEDFSLFQKESGMGKEAGSLKADILLGMEFQRELERRAYMAGDGKIPIQLLGDFLKNQTSRAFGEVEPCVKGDWTFGNVRGIFPEELARPLAEGISGCEQLITGFARPDAILSGVESRTSSPVRIVRNERLESEIKGLYPCGEGAGYAGGIMSAAMDGIKVAEELVRRYKPESG